MEQVANDRFLTSKLEKNTFGLMLLILNSRRDQFLSGKKDS